MISLRTTERYLKPAVFAACCVPLLWLTLRIFEVGSLRLGPNPVEDIQDALGIWGLRALCATLAMTPLSWAIGPLPIRFRRMFGLFAFTYAGLHVMNYLILDQTLAIDAIVEDIVERPFITIGALGFVMMIPLAVTSTNGWRRRLGRNWNRLHRLAYLSGIAGCWHFYWQVKKDLTEPLVYCAILAALLAARLVRKRHRAARLPPTGQARSPKRGHPVP